MKAQILYALLFLLTGISLFGQSDTSSLALSEVVISENRLSLPLAEQSRSIIVIDRAQIETAPVQSVNGLLSHFAGIDIRQRGPNGVQADVGIRGGSFDQVLILINGIKVSDLQTGHHSLNLPVDIENIERIEVLKGPGARVFGQNAFSGAINIITKSPDRPFVKAQVAYGEHDLRSAKISGAFRTGAAKHYLSFAHDESDGYRHNTDFQIQNLFYQSDVELGEGQLQVLGGLTARQFGANGFYASPDFTEQYEEVRTGLASVRYRRAIGDHVFLNSSAYFRSNHDDYVFVRADPSIYQNIHTNQTLGADANVSISSALGTSGIGIDVNQLWLESTNLGDRERTVATLFAEHRFSLLDGRLDLTPGVQLNHYSDFGFNALPGVDLGYAFTPQFGFFANWGRTYRVPTYTDLYYSDPVNNGNPNLTPEFANTWEVGLKTRRTRKLTGQISYFFRDGNDIIDWTKAREDDKWTPDNLIGVEAQGMDGNVSFRPFGQMGILERLDFGYTFIDASTVSTDPNFSRYALENLRHQIVGGVVLKYGRHLSHSIRFRHLDRVNLDDYSLVDSRLNFKRKSISIFVEATNIFDIEYKETNLVTMPGRWMRGGMSWLIEKRENTGSEKF